MSDASAPLYTVEMTLAAGLDDDQASRFAESFMDSPLSTSIMRGPDRRWQVQFLVEGPPDEAALADRLTIQAAVFGLPPDAAFSALEIKRVPDVNWLEESYRAFPPFRVGPFFIYGSHSAPDFQPGEMPLLIDAATAFGSGEHGTTAGCLLLMAALKDKGFSPRSVLDMGCGSGILAVAACRLWPAPVLAADIDPECVRVSKLHQDVNGIGGQMRTLCCDGFADIHEDYDLVIANILAAPLMEMAEDLARCVKPGGYAILSGMLQTQAEALLARYVECGLSLADRADKSEWSAVLLRK